MATRHMLLNLAVVGLFAINAYVRWRTPSGGAAYGLPVVALALLGAAGWIGGALVFEHGAGVRHAVTPGRERGDRTVAARRK